jgi:hypothetical protein
MAEAVQFDPDAFMAGRGTAPAFDPDAFMAAKTAPQESGLTKYIRANYPHLSSWLSLNPPTAKDEAEYTQARSEMDSFKENHPYLYGAMNLMFNQDTPFPETLTIPGSVSAPLANVTARGLAQTGRAFARGTEAFADSPVGKLLLPYKLRMAAQVAGDWFGKEQTPQILDDLAGALAHGKKFADLSEGEQTAIKDIASRVRIGGAGARAIGPAPPTGSLTPLIDELEQARIAKAAQASSPVNTSAIGPHPLQPPPPNPLQVSRPPEPFYPQGRPLAPAPNIAPETPIDTSAVTPEATPPAQAQAAPSPADWVQQQLEAAPVPKRPIGWERMIREQQLEAGKAGKPGEAAMAETESSAGAAPAGAPIPDAEHIPGWEKMTLEQKMKALRQQYPDVNPRDFYALADRQERYDLGSGAPMLQGSESKSTVQAAKLINALRSKGITTSEQAGRLADSDWGEFGNLAGIGNPSKLAIQKAINRIGIDPSKVALPLGYTTPKPQSESPFKIDPALLAKIKNNPKALDAAMKLAKSLGQWP